MSVMQTVVSWNASKEPEITYMEKFKNYQWAIYKERIIAL